MDPHLNAGSMTSFSTAARIMPPHDRQLGVGSQQRAVPSLYLIGGEALRHGQLGIGRVCRPFTGLYQASREFVRQGQLRIGRIQGPCTALRQISCKAMRYEKFWIGREIYRPRPSGPSSVTAMHR